MSDLLAEVEARLAAMTPERRREIEAEVSAATQNMRWTPNPGPQTEAYLSLADLLLFGGAAGGGKSALLAGLALNEHERSVIFRRAFVDLNGIEEELLAIHGSREGYNGTKMALRTGSRLVELGALEKPGAEFTWQGRPHDFIGFDEGAQLSAAKVRFVTGWLRSTTEGQRKRIVIASNPPMGGEGDWLIEWFAPWLDPEFPDPAEFGELRWALVQADDSTRWVAGPEPIKILEDGTERLATPEEAADEDDDTVLRPLSRSFIPAFLKDNPYITKGYRAQLQSLPEPMRTQLIKGDFLAGRKDADFQVIPSEWIAAAQDRWTERPPEGAAMTAMGVDVSFGGDGTELAPRYGAWFAPLVSIKGEDTRDGSLVAGKVMMARRDRCPIIVDLGGGYGGACVLRLKDNEVEPVGFNGAESTIERANDGSNLTFHNKRAMAWWRLREALNPDQGGGSPIALPPSAEVRADLAAPRWSLGPRGILVESKDKIRERLGRSPDKGDAIVMSWSEGQAAARLRAMPMPSQAVVSRPDLKFARDNRGFAVRANVGSKRLS